MTVDERRAKKAAYMRGWRARNLERAREIGRATRARHIEHVRAYDRAYSAANLDRQREYQRGWREANRERDRARRRAWRAANPAKIIEAKHRWLSEHPTTAQAIRAAANANTRAREYDADGTITTETVLMLWRLQPTCVDCGYGSGLDHVIPLSRGGSNTSGNLANRCKPCNQRKGRRLPTEIAA